MIKELQGDLLRSKCDIICHQVNLDGIMGGGLALQIANKYPYCEKQYKILCKEGIGVPLQGYVNLCQVETNPNRYIANCFSQNTDYTTNYKWLKECVKTVYDMAKSLNVKTVGIPKNYGCGIAKGNWEIVKEIWSEQFKNSNIELQIWEL